MTKQAGSGRAVLQMRGDLSRNIKYGLYGLYVVLFVVLWYLGSGSILRPFGDVLTSLSKLWFEKGLSQDIGASIQLNLVALGVTLLLTLIISYASVIPLFQPLAFALSKGRFLGLLGLNAIFIEVFGLGFGLKVALLTFGTSVFYLTSMYAIVTEIPAARFDYAGSLGLKPHQILWQVVIRGTADQMLESFRQNAAIGWMMITAVEGIVKAGGIGDILYNSYKHFDRGEVLAIIICILIIGILQDISLRAIQKIVTPHAWIRSN